MANGTGRWMVPEQPSLSQTLYIHTNIQIHVGWHAKKQEKEGETLTSMSIPHNRIANVSSPTLKYLSIPACNVHNQQT